MPKALKTGILLLFLVSGTKADASDNGITRRNFLRGAGTVAVAPLLPSVPLAAPLVQAVAPAAPNPMSLLGPDLMSDLGAIVEFSPGTRVMLNPLVKSALHNFYQQYENAFEEADTDGGTKLVFQDFLSWSRPSPYDGFGKSTMSQEDRLLGAKLYAREITYAIQELYFQHRFDPEFLRNQSLVLVRLLEGNPAELNDEIERLENGSLPTHIIDFRRIFVSHFKGRLPEIYRRQLHSWSLALNQNPYDARNLARILDNIGFESKDLSRYLKLSGHSDLQKLIDHYETTQTTESEVTTASPEAGAEVEIDEELSLARTQILNLIQLRKEHVMSGTCENLLASDEHLHESSQDEVTANFP